MKNKYFLLAVWACVMANSKISHAKEVKLTSKDFQKEFLQKVSDTMKLTAVEYLNKFLMEVEKGGNIEDDVERVLKVALASKRLEPKIVFIKQYLDLAEHKDTSRENMYGLRNVNFLRKLKNKFLQLQEESFEEIHHLRYFYLCKQFKIQKQAHHNYYSESTKLVPLNGSKSSLRDEKDIITINITKFGHELYQRVNESGSDVIDDYLIIIKKLLQEVLEPQSEEEATVHSDALRKILIEIDFLLKTADFYTKRQRLYEYLQNQLAVDYEQIQGSESSQHDLMDVFSKLKEKGFDLIMAFLFSNFEFIDHLQEQWRLLLPQAPISAYDQPSRQLKQIQDFYSEFKQDFENSTKYDSYLEAVGSLHQQSQQEDTDKTHIFEMLHSASQNVGSSRATLIFAKCNEV